MKINKSAYTPEQWAQLEQLLNIGKMAPADDGINVETPPAAPVVEKSVEADPMLTAALERLATLEKSYEMKQLTEVAKRFAPLGEREDELAQTLYDMKKSNEANYDKYIAALEKSLELVNKGGLFTEIGKSAGAYSTHDSVEAKIDAKAAEIRKNDPNMTHADSVAKAWMENPDLAAEYEAQYNK